jgi:signal transduction histidine kinase
VRPGDEKIIFDKFVQAGDTLTGKPQGSGLGLYICRHIIEHHGGRIWVQNRPQGGACFWFTLPIAEGA